MEDIVIVGGGPAALSAARGYRAAGGRGAVALVTDDDRPPYERPPLSKGLLRGDSEPHELPMEEDAFYREQGVDVVHARATALDADARRLTLADGSTRTYDGLVLATGATPNTMEADRPVFVLRSAADALRLRDAAEPGMRAVVVGTGFVGTEAAVSLARRGLAVTVVGQEPVPQSRRIGDEAGARIAAWLQEEGVGARHGGAVERIGREGVQVGEELLGADLVLLALGARPRDELARDAGLRLGSGGAAIAADGELRTTGDRVLAAGDCCEAWHPVAGRPLRVEHWGDALSQGTAAGRRLAGDPDACWDVVPGFWSEIGDRRLKHAAWGDGFEQARFVAHGAEAFTVWYADADGACVGVLTHDADADYERGRELVAAGSRCPG